jgi:hypothetical protein
MQYPHRSDFHTIVTEAGVRPTWPLMRTGLVELVE